MELEEIAARLGVQATMGRYTRFVDTGRAGDLAGLFAPDCLYDMGGGAVARGRDQIVPIVEGLKDRFRTAPDFGRLRHHVSSAVVEITGPASATAMSYFVAFCAQGPDHWGTYRDVLSSDGKDWWFDSRVVRVEGAASGSPVADIIGR
jgi:SnoaL-like domain